MTFSHSPLIKHLMLYNRDDKFYVEKINQAIEHAKQADLEDTQQIMKFACIEIYMMSLRPALTLEQIRLTRTDRESKIPIKVDFNNLLQFDDAAIKNFLSINKHIAILNDEMIKAAILRANSMYCQFEIVALPFTEEQLGRQFKFTIEVDKDKYAGARIPDEKRATVFDDILLDSIHVWLLLQHNLGREFDKVMQLKILDYFITNIQAYKDKDFIISEKKAIGSGVPPKKDSSLAETKGTSKTAKFFRREALGKLLTARGLLDGVRDCEHEHCTLNQSRSEFAKKVFENFSSELKKIIQKPGFVNKERFFYGGFASGLLGRDLKNFSDMLPYLHECRELHFLFVDELYSKFLAVLDEKSNLEDTSFEDYIAITLVSKAVNDFASWVAANAPEKLVRIYLARDIRTVQRCFETHLFLSKMDVLIGEDFFTSNGAPESVAQGTPTAHCDFTKMAHVGLKNGGYYLEIIKDDVRFRHYFSVGMNAYEGLKPDFIYEHFYKEDKTVLHRKMGLNSFKEVEGTKEDKIAPGYENGDPAPISFQGAAPPPEKITKKPVTIWRLPKR